MGGAGLAGTLISRPSFPKPCNNAIMRTFLDREKSAEAEFSHVRSPAPRIASSTVFGAAIRRSKSSPGFLALTAVLPPTCFKKSPFIQEYFGWW